MINTPAIPHTKNNQIGIPSISGKGYVQAPKATANDSDRAPQKEAAVYNNRSSLSLEINSITTLITNSIKVNWTGLCQNNETLMTVKRANIQLYKNAFDKCFIINILLIPI